MCGITGLWTEGTLPSLDAAVDALAHRGPDDSGTFYEPDAGVALGHTRLAILDLSQAGHQPMQTADGRLTIVYNGEIYNFPELRRQLEQAGHTFRSATDTEALLYLYLEHGVEMLDRLNGIFAFAIWDRTAQRLFLARDGYGVKPLYYHAGEDGFAFASEIKALQTPDGQLPDALDAASVHRYLSFLWCPGDGTALASVRKLGPGEAMVVGHNGLSERWTWYRIPTFDVARGPMTEQDAIAGVRTRLDRAVQRQLLSDAKLGAFLSGGLDSSAVVAFAKRYNPDIECFTIATPGSQEAGRADDLPYAQAAAKHLDVKLHTVEVTPERMADNLQRMVYQLDEPLGDPAALNVMFISQLARDHGVKVLLSGAGGDDLFTGYPRHLAIDLERLWSWMPKGWRARLDRAAQRLDHDRPALRRLAKLLSGAALDGDQRLAHYFQYLSETELAALYAEDFGRRVDGHAANHPMLAYLADLPADTPRIDRLLALDQRFFLTDHNLIYTDKMSMAAGVEVRVPFLDPDVADFAAQIPPRFKRRGREQKWVLKKAMEPDLPHDIIYRPKTGFGAPMRRWMRHELREMLGDMLSEQSLNRRGVFDPARVHELIRKNDAGEADASMTLFSLLTFEIWCRQFLDGDSFARA